MMKSVIILHSIPARIYNKQFQVDNLKEKLAIQEVELKIKNDAADKLIQIVGVETEKVSKEKSFGRYL